MKKLLRVFLVALMLLLSGCAKPPAPKKPEPKPPEPPVVEKEKIEFMGFGDFSHIVESGVDISLWNQLCEKPFPTFNTPPATIDPTRPVIALTFDDGPSAYTERLLNIFKANGIKGTFFVVGNIIEKRKNVLKRIAEEGHEIGNHSWSHIQLTTPPDPRDIVTQLMQTRAKIFEVTGVNAHLVRPPYGSYSDTMEAIGEQLGLCYINWSVDSLDWKSKDAKAVFDEIIAHVNDGAIILCHDLHETTVDAMETLIPRLIKDGYQFLTVSDLMSYSEKTITAGKIYYRK